MVMKFTWEATRKRNYQGRKVKVTSVHERGYHDMKNKQYQGKKRVLILTGCYQDTNCKVTRTSKHNIPGPANITYLILVTKDVKLILSEILQ